MEHAILFNKSYQERLQEFTDVLGGCNILPASQIFKEWCVYLQLSVDVCGWQAIWKIPRLTCEEFKIEFPTIALVYVDDVVYEELHANVRIITLQDEIDLPKVHCVPLIQLWPTQKQDKSVCLNLTLTANSIEMLRIFYTNLFLPWDIEEDCRNWFDKHLSSRLHLFYDLRNGTIPAPTAEIIKGLLTEARHLEIRQNCLLQNIDDDIPEQSKQAENLLIIRARMMEIRNEVEMLENPLLRNVLLENKPDPPSQSDERQYWAVFEEGKNDDFLSFLHQIKADTNDIICQSNLSLVLEAACTNDVIFLSPGKHIFSSLCALGEGGVIKGINSVGNTTLSSINEDIMLDCCGDTLFENITINVGSAQCGILVRSGCVTLRNCTIMGDFKSSTRQGIIVLADGKLNVEKCNITGFYSAIIVNSRATFSIIDSVISGVSVGVKLYDDSNIVIRNVRFEDCRDYGIYKETDNLLLCCAGEFDVLSKFAGIVMEDVVSDRIGKCPAKIHQKREIEPISDLLSNVHLNPVYMQHTCADSENEDVNVIMCDSN
ncbi:hypothetical protein PPYR_01003 [Photinus pyralis]|uniref:Uncharacterized protein n=1 Tax=Photinus pyralis TaxID=7054 RepID=A0A1Y1M6F4_PHOPY|nr:protein nessun dorma-like [Photinus pyralis]KAB0804033.1 hypothetical protein PPYR_01003 [Photinus pyralis]